MPPPQLPFNYFHLVLLLTSLLFLLFIDSIEPIPNQEPCFFGWGKNDDDVRMDFTLMGDITHPSPFGHAILRNKNITHVSAGNSHTVIVDSEGNSYCFGSNSHGECGQGFTGATDILIPEKVVSGEVFNQKKIVSSSLGFHRTYLRDEDGKVYFFGTNDLIDVSPSDFDSPMGLSSEFRFSSVSISNDFVLLLTDYGGLFAFGTCHYGQCGNGRTEASVKLLVAVIQNGTLHGKRITQISAGGFHSLVLSSDGEIFTFGSNDDGCLGIDDPTVSFKSTPVAVHPDGVLRGKVIHKISAGGFHNLVLSTDGELFAWGSNSRRQLGIGEASNVEYAPVSVFCDDVLLGKHVIEVASGEFHSLVLSSDGQVFGFGDNEHHQLGAFPATVQAFPIAIAVQGFIKQISAGGSHSLALSQDGDVYAWGKNSDGQCGTGQHSPHEMHPVRMNLGYAPVEMNITHISSYIHLLFRDESGNVIGFGKNDHGELGDATTISPRSSKPLILPHTSFEIAAGRHFTLILSSTGQVFAFGQNENSQCGIGKKTLVEATPVAVDPSGVLSGKTIVQIAAGKSHSLALSSDGEVFAWGKNSDFQCGIGEHSPNVVSRPAAVNTSTAHSKVFKQIDAGSTHSLILSRDGKIYGFGNNIHGNLGMGYESPHESLPIAVNTNGTLIGSFKQISVGDEHSLALSVEGIVFAFGRNSWGQCGVSSIWGTDSLLRPTPVDTSGALKGKTIAQVSAGVYHSLVLSVDGQMFAFGRNRNRELGSDSRLFSIVPVAVNFPRIKSAQVKILAGSKQSFVSYCPSLTCFGMDHLHPMICSGRGKCVAHDTCSCSDGFSGPICQFPICHGFVANNASVCSGKGKCTSPNQCHCLPAYEGEECDSYRCFDLLNDDPNVCNGNGRCISPSNCSCNTGYQGVDCGLSLSCFGISHSDTSTVCSGHGQCRRINDCECSWKWSGKMCESVSGTMWAIIAGTFVGGISFFGFCVGTLSCVAVLFRRMKRVEKEKKRTEFLLQGFVRDTEMDEMDSDSKRARLIVQQSMLEIEFSELSQFKKIASGGGGAILFRAVWNETAVAVKAFKSGLLSGETFFDEFEQEVSLMSTLRHRNVINFYGCSLAYPRIAIVMELCEAGSVQTLIENGTLQKKSSHEILRMVLDIAEGMSYLHSRGVIHRDLKCANVLVDEHGVCKLTDFGLSKYTKDKVAQSHTVGIGTSYYIAPELYKGQGGYDWSVDVYAFGIMAMEMLLSRMCPFPGNVKDTDFIRSRASQDATFRPDVSLLNDKYSFLRWMLKQCWHEDPQSRPPFRDIAKILKSSLFDTDG